jgi:beta-glucosidase
VRAQIAAARPPLLFVGDSITDGWTTNGAAAWNARFAPEGAVHAGIGGDMTQGVLFRMGAGGELPAGYAPRLVVLMIGTNNLGSTPACVIDGVRAVVKLFKSRSPQTKVLLLAILPRDGNDKAGRQRRGRVVTA